MAQVRDKKIATHKKKDLIIECATTIGYVGPVLCLATWSSFFDEAFWFWFKWGLIALALVLGIVVPVVFNKKK